MPQKTSDSDLSANPEDIRDSDKVLVSDPRIGSPLAKSFYAKQKLSEVCIVKRDLGPYAICK
jgi:hypothetical protein